MPRKKASTTSKKKITTKSSSSKQAIKAKLTPPQLLKGMKDIMPEEQRFWEYVQRKTKDIAEAYGFERIDTPVLEASSLFIRSVGKNTDIVEKEMFAFTDQGGDNICARPELTASIVRAYNEHGMINRPQPVKLYSIGPVFRHDKPQAGRYRQFYQCSFEVIGDDSPVIDAELISLQYNLFKDFGIESAPHINSVGCPDCRPQYIQVLQDYYRTRRKNLCENCKKRYAKNPLRLLDCKEKICKEMSEEAPQIVDHLCENCKKHFIKVLEHLDEAEIPYNLNPRIVRGLDYYTRTAFEFFPVYKGGEKSDTQSAISAGGRYDGLVKIIGGREEISGSGFACGIERIILAIKNNEIEIPEIKPPDVFLAQIGESARKRSLKLLEELRKMGFYVRANLSKSSLSSQLTVASKLPVKFTLILGQKELTDQTIIIRDMASNSQEIIDMRKLQQEIQKRLDKLEASKLV